MKRIAIALVAAAAVVPLVALGTSTALGSVRPASSYGCVEGDSGYCGSQYFPLLGSGDLVMSVKPGAKIKNGTPIVVEPQSDSQMQDFDTRNYNGVGNSKSFEFAPAGHVSGFCVADHTGQTGEGLELVTCNFGPGQTFTPNQDPNDSDVYAWVSGRDSQNVITDPGDGGRGTRLRMELNGTYDDQELEWTSTV